LQYALKKAGVYKGNIDGVYGDLTYDAVRAYQRKKGLAVDGMAGLKTLNSLNKNTKVNVGTSFQLAEGSKGREVEELMHYLREKGFTNENSDFFSAQLTEDVKAWQAATGKEVTGMITEAQYNNIVLGKEK
jgi:peptidoglycan hydrolase-like protein with peptidoglycan-binding domain